MRPGVAGLVRLRARWPLRAEPAVVVLGWHRIDVDGGRLAIPPPLFARQLALLDGCRPRLPVTSIIEARDLLAAGQLRGRHVALTFDDAWADNHSHALGPLTRHRMPATLYAPSRLLGKPAYMTPAQLREMDAAGITIGAHSRTHRDLRTCSEGELESEVRGSKEDLEDLLSKPVTSFAYPAGLLNDRVIAAVAAAGFSSAVSSRPGSWLRRSKLLQIPRAFVEDFSDETFLAAARGGMSILRVLDAVKRQLPIAKPDEIKDLAEFMSSPHRTSDPR
jgi:peptidoglycan/xylan/chitin deacetylase (PgdA/CDA1 family)